MWQKIKCWWSWYKPILTTSKKQLEMMIKYDAKMSEINARSNWSAINPVIHSLEELRNNTWDVERVDHAINWLKDNFEEK